MNKLKKLFKTILLILKQPSLVNYILNSEDVWNMNLSKHYPDKISLPVVELEDVIQNFNEKLSSFSFLGGGSLPTDIMLLKGLANQIKDCKYFEIGTWRGESVINVAESAKDCFTLNLSKQEMIDLSLPEKYAELHGFFSKKKNNITHLFGDSLKFDFKGLNMKFDLIFIDGNHTYDFVKSDTVNVFEHLMHDNTIVVWHDYAFHPEKVRAEVYKAILDGVPKNLHKNLYHVSNTMCAIYTKTDFKTSIFQSIATPKKTFNVIAKVKNI